MNENGFYQATGLELDSSDSRGPFLLQELQGTDDESLNYVITVCSFSRSVLSSFVDVLDFLSSCTFEMKADNQFIKLGLLFLGW